MTYELLTIKLTYPDGSIHDVSDLLVPDSYQEKLSLCGEDRRSSINSASFSLYYSRNLFLDMTVMTDMLGVSVWSDIEEIFRGYIDPIGTVQIVGLDEVSPIPMEAVDQLSLLDGDITDDLSYPPILGDAPWKVYDPDDLPHSILFDLLVRLGLHENIAVDAPAILDTVRHYSVTVGSGNWKQAVDDLLFERRMVITSDGPYITWKPWSEESPIPIAVISEEHLLSQTPLSIGTRYDRHDGDKVEWSKATLIENTRLWEGSTPVDGDGLFPGEPIAAGDYWPEDSDIREVWQEYQNTWLDIPYLTGSARLKNEDISLLATGSWYVKDAKDPDVALDPVAEGLTVDFRAKRARLRYLNSGDAAQRLYYTYIYGDALIRSQKPDVTVPATARRPETYTSITVFDSDTADALARALYNQRRYGKVQLSFKLEAAYQPGDVVEVYHESEDLRILARIIDRTVTRGSAGLYSYTASGCAAISTGEVRRRGYQGSMVNRPPIVPQYQYAPTSDGPWHTPYVEGDFYYRLSVDGGVTWTVAIRFRGEAGSPAPRYLGKVLELPPDPQEFDFVLFAADDTGGYQFGRVYVYNGTGWEETHESDYIMAVGADAQKLAYDTGRVVYAAEVFAWYFVGRNLVIGPGNGTAGSGLLFEILSGDEDAVPAVPPIIRARYGANKLWRIDPVAGDFEIGDYAGGKGAIYNGATGEFFGKFSELRNVLPFQFMDSLDSTHPLETEFFIPTDTVRIVSIKVNARGSKYRAYSYALGVDEPFWGRTTESATPSMSLSYNSFGSTGSAGNHAHSYERATGTGNGGGHSHSLSMPFYDNASTSSVNIPDHGYHSHGYQLPTGTGSVGDHSHGISSSSANTGSSGSHSHTVNLANGVTGGAHTHQYNIEHDHQIQFGIFEGTTPANVLLYIDNGSGYGSGISLGSSTVLAADLDITAHLSGTGWKSLKFTSSRMGRINVQIIVEVDITA